MITIGMWQLKALKMCVFQDKIIVCKNYIQKPSVSGAQHSSIILHTIQYKL